MKAKIFNIESGNNAPVIAEREMNLWLSENSAINITNVVFNSNDYRFILVIFYTENKL